MQAYQFKFEFLDNFTSFQRNMNSAFGGIGSNFEALEKDLNGINAPMQKMQNSFGGIGRAIAGAFAVNEIVGFGRSVIDTLSEFEKFEAVLTNTLGSNSGAKQVLGDIKKFAASTPFEVNELTDAFIRLQNRGLQPNMKMMKMLGDLAASQGKSFEQVSEAFMDAPVKQFMRLQEALGINVEAMKGGLLKFEGLGVSKIIKDDPETIKAAVLELSKLPQVAGAMDAISKTTGGMLSNMRDEFTQTKLSIGEAFEPLVKGVIPELTKSLKGISEWVNLNKINMLGWAQGFIDVGLRSAVIYGIITGYSSLVGLYTTLRTLEMPMFIINLAKSVKWLAIQGFTALQTARSYLTLSAIQTGAMNIQFGMGFAISMLRTQFIQLRAGMTLTNIQTLISGGLMSAYAFIVGGLSTVFGTLRSVLSMATLQQLYLNVAMYANPIGLIIAGVAALAAVFYGLFKLIDSLFPNFFSGITQWFGKAFDWVYNNFIQPLVDAFRWLFGLTNFEFPKLEFSNGLSDGLNPTPKNKKKVGVQDRLSGGGNGGKENSVSGGTNIKHITINLEALIKGGLTIQSTTLTEGISQAKEIVANGLMSSLNDYNYSN